MSRVECMRRVLLTLHVFKCPCQQRQADNSAVGSPRCLFYMYLSVHVNSDKPTTRLSAVSFYAKSSTRLRRK